MSAVHAVSEFVRDLHHLTWPGRWEYVTDRLRSIFIAPAPNGSRCIMGAPIGPNHRCPRHTVSDDPSDEGFLWCAKHLREVES